MTSQSFFSTTQFLNPHNTPPHFTCSSCRLPTSSSSSLIPKSPRKKLQKPSSFSDPSSSSSSSLSIDYPSNPSNYSNSSNGSSSFAATTTSLYTEEENEAMAKVGARVRVCVPLKVYHIPRVPEFDMQGLEGELKQFVGVWKGKRISANLPFKVQFVVESIEGRDGPVKFFAHLREDEFEYVE